MKKIFTYMTLMAAALFTACSDDDIAQSSSVTSLDKYAVTGTMANVAEFVEGAGESDALRSKSQLYYDRVAGKLKFTWTKPEAGDPSYNEKVDHIGIFAKENGGVQFNFKLDPAEDLKVQETSVTGVFMPSDDGVSPITGGKQYYSYFPYKDQSPVYFTSVAVPMSYSGQVQTANEQMGYYFSFEDGLFLESEKEAAAHLCGYEYMISDATATAGNHVHFHYSHVGSIVRFYMTCPSTVDENMFYDSLQVYNSQANFTIDATMNLATKELTPTKTSHVMSLGFHPAIDMTCNDKHTTGTEYEREISWYWKKDGSKGYIMAYMMVAPIDLHEIAESPTLYLIGRKASYYTLEEYNAAKGTSIDVATFNALPKIQKMKIYETYVDYNTAKGYESGDPGYIANAEAYAYLPASDKMKDYERKVYKAELVKLKLEAGKHHQWVPAINPDSPIEFNLIEIQEWKDGPGFTNEDGAGTDDW